MQCKVQSGTSLVTLALPAWHYSYLQYCSTRDCMLQAVMGNTRSVFQLRAEEIAEITEETGFTKQQIERLYTRFTSLDRNSHGFLTREDFLRIPELAINPLGDRIVHAFFYESKNIEEEKVDFKVDCDIYVTFSRLVPAK